MNDLLLIATQDQALHAILAHVDQPSTDPALRAVVCAVTALHGVDPPDQGPRPAADCEDCDGTGVIDMLMPDDTPGTVHCHCQCQWCPACDEPLCAGMCPTIAAVAVALGLLPPEQGPACGGVQPVPAGGLWMAYRCSETPGHGGDCRAVIDGRTVATWPRKAVR